MKLSREMLKSIIKEEIQKAMLGEGFVGSASLHGIYAIIKTIEDEKGYKPGQLTKYFFSFSSAGRGRVSTLTGTRDQPDGFVPFIGEELKAKLLELGKRYEDKYKEEDRKLIVEEAFNLLKQKFPQAMGTGAMGKVTRGASSFIAGQYGLVPGLGKTKE